MEINELTLNLLGVIMTCYTWLHLLRLYYKCCVENNSVRRWHVKPHLTDAERDDFGAYETLFLYFANHNHEDFFKMTRMSVYLFQKLHRLVGPRLIKTSLRRPLSTELRLALTLNYLAHGDSQTTTSNFFRVGKSTTYEIIKEVCPIIWELLSPIYLKNKSPQEWKLVAEGFRINWNFPNCIGAMDGKEIRIMAPPHSGSLFFNYKHFHSFKLMALCDAYQRFIWVDIGDYGSISDTSAFKNTDFYIALERGEASIPDDCIIPHTNTRLPMAIVGDAIFPLKKYLMKPYPRNNGLTERQKVFNKRLSRARNCIEDTFGKLVQKWEILERRLDFKLSTSVSIVQATVCLHNFLREHDLLLNNDGEEVRSTMPGRNEENDEDPIINEEDIPPNVVQQRELLADYFISPQGQINFN